MKVVKNFLQITFVKEGYVLSRELILFSKKMEWLLPLNISNELIFNRKVFFKVLSEKILIQGDEKQYWTTSLYKTPLSSVSSLFCAGVQQLC